MNEHAPTAEQISEKLKRWMMVGFKLSEIGSMEGKIITARDVLDYAGSLRFALRSLEGKRLLDVGCGASNIGQDLKKEGIEATVIGVDLTTDPSTDKNGVPPVQMLLRGLNLLSKMTPMESRTREKLLALKRRLAGTADRLFVQADGRQLPFSDASFDEVFALQSTYQIPFEERVKVFRELMRVGNVVRISPIFKQDYDALVQLADELGFEVLECTDSTVRQLMVDGKAVQWDESFEEYEARTKKIPTKERIYPPRVEEPVFDISVTGQLRTNFHESGGETGQKDVCRIVLKRKSKEQ